MRTADLRRRTAETDIALTLNLDGSGRSDIRTGCGFLNHMLTLFAAHGRFDLLVRCEGDTEVDAHHTVEDVGICLGEAFRSALGEKRGITRYGSIILPMDEALILASVDISGRGGCFYTLRPPTEKVGEFDTELGLEFWLAFARASGITLHLRQLAGENSHHILEGGFKAMGRSLRTAVSVETRFAEEIPSTKGML